MSNRNSATKTSTKPSILPTLQMQPQSDILSKIKAAISKQEILVIHITPAIANDLLMINPERNRLIDERLVLKYTQIFREKRWKYNGMPIIVTKSGKMFDGQKRLYACIISGVSFKANIQCGIDDEDVDTIDEGQKRSGSDALYMDGHKAAKNKAAAIKPIIMFKASQVVSPRGRSNVIAVDNAMIRHWPRENGGKNGKLLEEGMDLACTYDTGWYYKEDFLSQSQWAFIFVILSEKNKTKGFEFVNRLANGANMSETKDSAIFFCRRRLREIKDLIRKNDYKGLDSLSLREAFTKKLKFIFLAWNFWIDNARITMEDMKLSKEEQKSLIIKTLPKRP